MVIMLINIPHVQQQPWSVFTVCIHICCDRITILNCQLKVICQ